MPELPEVETIKRQLSEVLIGQTIKAVEVRRAKSFQDNPKDVIGKKITGIDRRAKMLIIELSHEPRATSHELALLIHLKMTGQLIYQATSHQPPATSLKARFSNHQPHFKFAGRIVGGHPTPDWVEKLPSNHTRIILQLTKGKLFFNDMRVFGWIKVITNQELDKLNQGLPPDVIDANFSLKYFTDYLARTGRPVKIAITDQNKMGGVGNIYANDALWQAKIHPRRPAKSLNLSEINQLHRALKLVLKLGIKYGGATASDDKFVHTTGLGGKYQEHFLVYEQDGKPCHRCQTIIKKIRLAGRGTYYCPHCQPLS